MKKKILIIEDDEDIVSYLKEVLSNLIGTKNVEFSIAYEKEPALEILKKETFSLITLDGYLIYSHGRDVLKKMSDEQKEKTIVYSSDIGFQLECQEQNISVVGKNTNSAGIIKEELVKKGII